MDRRTILAFAIIFLLYIGWLEIYKRTVAPPAPPTSEQAVTAPAPAAAPAPGPADPVAGPATEAPVQAAPAGDPRRFAPAAATAGRVRVATDLFDLEIDPVGARVVSWVGRKYRGPDGGGVQLVPEAARVAAAGDAVVGDRGRLDLGSAPFAVEGAADVQVGAADGARSVVMTAVTEAGVVVRKTFTFHPGRYDFDVDIEVEPRDAAAGAALREVVGDAARARFAWPYGIASTERNKKWEADGFRAVAMVGEELTVKRLGAMGRDGEKVRAQLEGSIRYAAVQNKYFLIAGFVPAAAQGRPVEARAQLGGDPSLRAQSWEVELPLVQAAPQPGSPAAARLGFYLGPAQYQGLAAYGVGLEKSVDLGWKMFQPLAALTLRFMTWLYRWIPNYGVVIILLSILVKVIFYPLTRSSTRSMKRMQEVAPRMKALQEKHKGNQQKLSEEMMKLYKEEKINPMGGCLPMLLQMPVFIALYQALSRDIALRQAPFTLWIDDLGQPDALFTLPFSLPFLGNEFNLLPLLMAASTYWQMKLTPQAPTAGPSMALMNKLMPVMMLFFFYTFPSGLVLYWLVMNIMSIYQTWRIHTTTPATGGAQSS